MDEKTFKKLLAEQTKSIDARIDQRLAEQTKSIDAKMDQRLAEQTKSIDARIDQRLAEQTKEFNKTLNDRFAEQDRGIDDKLEAQDVRMMQYVGALGEEYQINLQAALEAFIPLLDLPRLVNENTEALSELRQTVDPTFERVGELSESETITTETLHNHEKRIHVLETR